MAQDPMFDPSDDAPLSVRLIDNHAEVLQTIVDSARDAIVMVDSVGNIIFWSKWAERLFGWTAEEAIGKNVHDHLATPERLDVARLATTGYRERGVHDALNKISSINARCKDGTVIPVELSLAQVNSGSAMQVVAIVRDVRERQLSNMRLNESENRNRALVEAMPDAVFMLDGEEHVYYANQVAANLFGLSVDKMVGLAKSELFCPEDDRRYSEYIESARRNKAIYVVEHKSLHLSPGRWFEIRVKPIMDNDEVIGTLIMVRDVTERNLLKEQLQQAQKMEAIGRLAGGLAHDFNNHLTVIIGNLGFIQDGLRAGSEEDETAREIKEAAQNAAELTRRLLSFSRKQPLQPTILGVDELLSDIVHILRRLIGEDIAISTNFRSGAMINADQIQIRQAIMNLSVNARDAMPNGGMLEISTEDIMVTGDEAMRLLLRPGPYCRIRVSDTGGGIPPQNIPLVFDPFFTTKPVDKGTGLGLSMVYGTLKQHGGAVDIQSEVGRGTTIDLYLPHTSAAPTSRPPKVRLSEQSGVETILLVEDEPPVLRVTRIMLENLGYRVLTASRPDEAMAILEQHEQAIDLLLTDMTMPGMNGLELAEKALGLRKSMKVLFMSGYPQGTEVRNFVDDRRIFFIQKPWARMTLAQKLREVLD